MSRPIKSGVDYFPLDCVLDQKFELIEAEFGLKGFAVIVKLYQKIYGEFGYYCEWTNEVALLFSRKIGEGCSAVSEIVSASIKRGIFDKDLYEKYGILTSRGIQERYFSAVSRRDQVEVKSEYLLVKVTQKKENVDKNPVNVCNNPENVCNNPQSKGKKSKVKNSIHTVCDADKSAECVDPCPYAEIMELFNATCTSMPQIRSIDGTRRKVVHARWVAHPDIEVFRELFETAQASSFLTGVSKNGWRASFDWLVASGNFTKVLEGNYADRKPKRADEDDGRLDFDLEDIFEKPQKESEEEK